jgi:hypothetical protein
MAKTTTSQLIEHRLGRDLTAYVGSLRAEGLGWRRVATRVTEETGVPVSHEALRSWFTTLEEAA